MTEAEKGTEQQDKIFVKAYDVASVYDIAGVRKLFEEEFKYKILEASPLLVQLHPEKMAAVFDYGSVVFFNVEPEEARYLMQLLNPFAQRPNKTISEDEFTLNIAHETKVPEGTDVMFIRELNRDIALVVGIVLSRSVSIEFYEKLVAGALAQLEQPIAFLQDTGKIPHSQRELTKRVGFALSVEQELAYTLSAFDDPDVVWDGGKRIEELYANLKRRFDLQDRINIIQQKVSIISRSSTFVISRIEDRRSQILEWIIILLIVLEILLFVFWKV
ncbi:MAG TPA: RMD1 family protein [Bacteroidota bacterium]|jgi:uncharacterized Rmd1/YagE family protein|nr:RMD1 family protein [Bacteroidota bacterium]